MSYLSVALFGKLEVRFNGELITSSLSQKAQELLAYLVLHRRSHPREKLATLLWQHGTRERTKAYLRKALWQLRQPVEASDADIECLCRANGDWVQIDPEIVDRVDATEFEAAFNAVRDHSAEEMSPEQIRQLEEAVDLYTGDLLENWYQEWCLEERERLQDMLLRMLDRLTQCCEERGDYDSGIQYGQRALRIDPARERIHRHLMRLWVLAGDRTGALRQYERCAEVLDRELNVSPSAATQSLREQIQDDRFPPLEASLGLHSTPARSGDGAEEGGSFSDDPVSDHDDRSLRDGLERIRRLQNRLDTIQKEIRREVEAVKGVLARGEGEQAGRSSN